MTAPEPGWYADPAGVAQNFRWWDGATWTRWLSSDPTSTPPRIGAVDDVQRAAPAPPRSSSTEAAAVHTPITYDPRTRLALVQEMRFVAPAKPFVCLPAPNVQSGVFRSYFACDALVHENYSTSEDWHSSVGFAVLDDPLIVRGELGQTADQVATTLRAFYPPGQVTIRKRKLEDLQGVSPSGKSVLLSMELHLSVKGLPTTYDTLIIAIVELANGEYATWFATDPDDSPKDVSKVLKSSASTVTAKP